jgi:hypothetical protein
MVEVRIDWRRKDWLIDGNRLDFNRICYRHVDSLMSGRVWEEGKMDELECVMTKAEIHAL